MHHSMVKVCIYLFNRTLDIELTEILENVPLSTVQKSDASGVEENDLRLEQWLQIIAALRWVISIWYLSHTVGDGLPPLATSFRGRRLKDKLLAMLRIKSFFANPDSTFLHANDLGMGTKVYAQ
jgi:hypothetical protein